MLERWFGCMKSIYVHHRKVPPCAKKLSTLCANCIDLLHYFISHESSAVFSSTHVPIDRDHHPSYNIPSQFEKGWSNQKLPLLNTTGANQPKEILQRPRRNPRRLVFCRGFFHQRWEARVLHPRIHYHMYHLMQQ